MVSPHKLPTIFQNVDIIKYVHTTCITKVQVIFQYTVNNIVNFHQISKLNTILHMLDKRVFQRHIVC